MNAGKSQKNNSNEKSPFKVKLSRILFGWSLCLLWVPWEHFLHATNFGYFKGKVFVHFFKDTITQSIGSFLYKQGMPEYLVVLSIILLTVFLIFGFVSSGRQLRASGNKASTKFHKWFMKQGL